MAYTIEGKITCVRFPSQCNVAFGNALVLVPQGSLKGASFCSWCNVFIGYGFASQCNVIFCNALVDVLQGKLAHVRFHLASDKTSSRVAYFLVLIGHFVHGCLI